jgi:hypothetical protein
MFFVVIFRYGILLGDTFRVLTFASIISLFIALSNDILIGETRILKIGISDDAFLIKVFQMIRSSGRFYWVTGSVVLILIFKYFYFTVHSRVRLFSFFGFILAIQIADLSPYHFSKNSNDTQAPISNPHLPQLLQKTNTISFMNYFDISLCRDLLMLDKKINRFYMAHGAGEQSSIRLNNELENFRHSKFTENTAYLVDDLTNLPYEKLNKVIKLDSFNYLFTNNLPIENRRNASKIKVINHKLTLAQLKEKLTSNALIILVNEGSEIADFKPIASSSITDFPMYCIEGERYMAVFKNGTLQTNAKVTKNSFQLSYLNHTISLREIQHVNESGKYLTVDGFNILKPRKGLSFVSIDENGVIHTGFVEFSEQ